MEAIITAATVLASYLNVATANQSGYMYNASYEDNKVTKIEVYNRSGNTISRKLKNHFEYDAQGRLQKKETFVWNSETAEWMPCRLYSYSYNDLGYTISLSEWNSSLKQFAEAKEKTGYHIVADNVIAVDNYKRENKDHEFEMNSATLVLAPQNDIAAK